jgi:hypothetical protein
MFISDPGLGFFSNLGSRIRKNKHWIPDPDGSRTIYRLCLFMDEVELGYEVVKVFVAGVHVWLGSLKVRKG